MFNYYKHVYQFLKQNIVDYQVYPSGRLHFLSPSDSQYDYVGKRTELPYLVQDSCYITSTEYNQGKMDIHLILTDKGIMVEYQTSNSNMDNLYSWLSEITLDVSPEGNK